jgi:hypothetical protein
MIPPWLAPIALAVTLPGVVATLRQLRAQGTLATRSGACQSCGRHGPVEAVDYHQNTGMVFQRESRALSADLCRRCSTGAFLRMTGHTAVLGWWGTISFFLTPIFLLNNLGYFLRSQTLPSFAALRARKLDEQRDYALALLATKDREVVVEVLARQAGAPPAEVSAWLTEIAREAARGAGRLSGAAR